ncbi:MAP kinase cascade scaffold protein Ahk1 [Schizosaccharomyces osmophilus]|uniref:MAP kinase cascade scaffold protein Ahk1 n=1 Tax=Schizosaccharomyces osmophilus TaxID=2545709 RepID=A0AAE9WCV7_9SCHI|nr:MAP kinase cascade scaffold protein Ahk1 [Schizosaccharomyces osmophilus]WBW74021.1 MAP kinase cascade scaffold protein Ahk1 [Schizosaccharomyces osmophilus]
MADTNSRYELLMTVMGPPNSKPSHAESEKSPAEISSVVVTPSESFEDIQSLKPNLSLSDQATSPSNDFTKGALASLSNASREASNGSSSSSSYSSSRSPSPHSSESLESQSSRTSKSFEKNIPYGVNGSPEKSPLVEQFIAFVSCTDAQRGTILSEFLFSYLNGLSVRCITEPELDKTRHILYTWWSFLIRLLETTQVALSERFVYIKSIVTIAEHSCWKGIENSELLNMEHQLILFDTLSFVVHLLSQKVLPHTLVKFCAKILVLSFFRLEKFANRFLRALKIDKKFVKYFSSKLNRNETNHPEKYMAPLFPKHLYSVMFATRLEKLDMEFTIGYGRQPIEFAENWFHRFHVPKGGLFFEFLAEYHSYLAQSLSFELPSDIIYYSPGYIHLHAYLLQICLTTVNLSERKCPTTGAFLEFPTSKNNEINSPSEVLAVKPAVTTTTIAMLQQLTDHVKGFFVAVKACRQQQLRLLDVLECTLQGVGQFIRVYDFQASFMYCSLSESWFEIFFDYSHRPRYSFWIEAMKKLVSTSNHMAIVRSITFVYTIWPYLDLEDKKIISFRWLLVQETFEYLFLHHFSLVRAYFHRFLCWRLLKVDDESETELKAEIVLCLKRLLKHCYSGYKCYTQGCLRSSKTIPTAKPSAPLPLRRLVIVCNSEPSSDNCDDSGDFEIPGDRNEENIIDNIYTDVVTISNTVSSGLRKVFGSFVNNKSRYNSDIEFSKQTSMTNNLLLRQVMQNRKRQKPRHRFTFIPSPPDTSGSTNNRENFSTIIEHSSHGVLPTQSKILLYNSNNASAHYAKAPLSEIHASKLVYASQALVEWALVVHEFDSFILNRKDIEETEMIAPLLTVRIPKLHNPAQFL